MWLVCTKWLQNVSELENKRKESIKVLDEQLGAGWGEHARAAGAIHGSATKGQPGEAPKPLSFPPLILAAL